MRLSESRTKTVVALAILLVAAGTLLAFVAGSARRDQAAEAPEPAPPTTREFSYFDGWRTVPLPSSVAASGAVVAWTGDEIIFWGGQDETSQNVPDVDPGAAYSLTTGSWRQLPTSPKPVAYGTGAAWTGEELIVVGGTDSDGPSSAVAAYDPIRNKWRQLADSPIRSEFTQAVWTDFGLLVVGHSSAAIFDPASGSWQFVPPALEDFGRLRKVEWTGSQLIVWPSPVSFDTSRGQVFDTDTGLWASTPDPPFWPVAPDLEWTGSELAIWGFSPDDESDVGLGALYHSDEDRWTPLPALPDKPPPCDCNLGAHELIWTGVGLLVITTYPSNDAEAPIDALLAFEAAGNRWRYLRQTPNASPRSALMANEQIVLISANTIAISEPNWWPEEAAS